jgi:hypothetical protein
MVDVTVPGSDGMHCHVFTCTPVSAIQLQATEQNWMNIAAILIPSTTQSSQFIPF